MEVDFEGKDGKQQDKGEQLRRRSRQPELDPNPAIQGILGTDLENAYRRKLRSAALRVRNSEPRGQPRWQLRSGAQGQTVNGLSVEAGKGPPQCAALVRDEPRGSS